MSLQGGVEAAVTAGVCRYLFQVLTVMIDPEAAADVRLEAVFSFTDSLVTVRVELRRGVCLVSRGGGGVSGGGGGVTEGGGGAGLEVETTEAVWRLLLAGQRSWLAASLAGEVRVRPSLAAVKTFFGYFDRDV